MRKNILILVFCAILMVNLSGCVLLFGAAAGGAGTAYWLSGKLRDKVDASYGATIEASRKALESFDMAVTKQTRTEEVTQIKSEHADGRVVWIDVRPLTQKSTQIEIRVGALGDKEASTEIMEKIKKYL